MDKFRNLFMGRPDCFCASIGGHLSFILLCNFTGNADLLFGKKKAAL